MRIHAIQRSKDVVIIISTANGEGYSHHNLRLAYMYSVWLKGVVTYIQNRCHCHSWPYRARIWRGIMVGDCKFYLDSTIEGDTFVFDRNVIKPDKNIRYCVYCGLQAVCQPYLPNIVIMDFLGGIFIYPVFCYQHTPGYHT